MMHRKINTQVPHELCLIRPCIVASRLLSSWVRRYVVYKTHRTRPDHTHTHTHTHILTWLSLKWIIPHASVTDSAAWPFWGMNFVADFFNKTQIRFANNSPPPTTSPALSYTEKQTSCPNSYEITASYHAKILSLSWTAAKPVTSPKAQACEFASFHFQSYWFLILAIGLHSNELTANTKLKKNRRYFTVVMPHPMLSP